MGGGSSRRRDGRARRTAGFTLVELLLVVVLLTVLSVVAYPALKTFSERDEDANLATFVVRELNRVKSQAQQRGRAYIVELDQFAPAAAQGSLAILEGASNSCRRLETQPVQNDRRQLVRYGFGGTAGDRPPGLTGNRVGLSGWVAPGAPMNQRQVGRLRLCVRTDGAVVQASNGDVEPLAGRVRLLVQRFEGDGDGASGPARVVEIPFSGAVRLGLN